MTFQPFDLSGQPVETPTECRFHPLGIIRRQIQGERGFDDERLRHAFAVSIVGKLAGEVPWQTKGVFGSHRSTLEFDAVAGIHRSLAREAANLATQDARLHSFIVRFLLLLFEGKFLRGFP